MKINPEIEKMVIPNPKRPPMVTRYKNWIKENYPHINLVDMGIPLTNGEPYRPMKDILEKEVDQSYYLKHEYVEKLLICPENVEKIRRLVEGGEPNEPSSY